MAITNISVQPATGELRAAYQSTIIEAFGFSVVDNQVVYFDVYFNSVYYKTITTTTPAFKGVLNVFRADIKDAAQEYLQSLPPKIYIAGVVPQNESITTCFVRVRGSSLSGGIITPEGPEPVQATVDQAASSGGGIQTNTFRILNMAVQHEDHQTVRTFLSSSPWSVTNSYPFLMLSKNAAPGSGMEDYGFCAFMFDVPGGVILISPFEFDYFVRLNGVDYFPLTSTIILAIGNVYYIPMGIKNIRGMPAGSGIPFYTATSYQVGLKIPGGAKVLTSPPIKIDHNSSSARRTIFRNFLGHYEALSFNGGTETFKAVSGSWEKPYTAAYPTIPSPTSGNKSIRGGNRFNVRSNEAGTLLGSFEESQMWLVAQLAGSPDAYLQWKGTYSQLDDLLPINILDDNLDTLKADERYSYDVALKFEMANPNIHTRS